jgi:hypothetical protein
MKKQIFLAVMLSVVCVFNAVAQSWVKNYPPDTAAIYSMEEIIATSDSSYLLLGIFDESPQIKNAFSIKVDSKGNILSRFKFPALVFTNQTFELANKDFLVIGNSLAGEPFKGYLLDKQGKFKQTLPFSNLIINPPFFNSIGSGSITRQNDSTYATFDSSLDSIFLVTFNPLKNIIYRKSFIDTASWISHNRLPINIQPIRNGYVCLMSYDSTTTLIKTNLEGQIVDRMDYSICGTKRDPSAYFTNFIKDSQENFYLVNSYSIYKIGNSGGIIWRRGTRCNCFRYSTLDTFFRTINFDVKLLKNRDIVIIQNCGRHGQNIDNSVSIYKLSENGDSLQQKTYKIPMRSGTSATNLAISPTFDAGFVIGRYTWAGYPLQWNTPLGVQLVKIDGQAGCSPTIIVGKVVRNLNNNCSPNIREIVVPKIEIQAIRSDGQIYYGYTDRLGNYSIYCDTGSYSIKTVIINGLWEACIPSVSRQISTVGATDTVNFLLKPLFNCHRLIIDLSTTGLRRCLESSISVNYCNDGTIPATNAYVDVRLDSLVEFISASRPLASQNRNVFRFNLGTIGIGECGSFTINGRVRCGDSTHLGQTLCNEAHIYPDSVCLPTGTFSGANLTVSGSCVGDSVQFIVKNIGTVTSQNARSVVLEDEVLFRFNINGLSPNATFSKKYKANGSTWRMIVEQEPNNPNSQFPTAFVEGCGRNGNGGVSTGFGTTFGNDDASPSLSTLCRPIIGSFDPNDKQGFPTGYKTEHFIRQNQDLDYVIRFQNTGTDTAFLVTIRDTLSDVLDLASIEFGGSSHAYTADIYGKNIVKFTFQNINLPDSFRNVAASQGFVKFRIKQKKDLPIGTKINNKAGIYFDFNDPIITNTTLHTVARDVLITAIVEPNKTPNSLTINVSPNPFAEHTTFELLENDKPFNRDFSTTKFELYDALGRLLRSEKITNDRFDFHRKELTSGLYFFKITDGGKVIGIGKLVVQ